MSITTRTLRYTTSDGITLESHFAAPANAAGKVQGELLVESGADDPMVPPEAIAAFEVEMQQAGVAYHIDIFPGVRHGFTNPQATANGEKNHFDALRYDQAAAQTSWQNMLNLLQRKLA